MPRWGRRRTPEPEDPGDLGRLGLALVGARSGDHRPVAVHDHGVLDEDTVRAGVHRRHLDGLPAGVTEGVDVPLPLLQGQVDVHGLSLDVRDEAVGEPAGRTTDEGAAFEHAEQSPGATGDGQCGHELRADPVP